MNSCSHHYSDGNIRYFEYENDKFEFLSEYKSGDPQRGIAFLPKRGVNVGFRNKPMLRIMMIYNTNVGKGSRK